jgi:hypothetical protein
MMAGCLAVAVPGCLVFRPYPPPQMETTAAASALVTLGHMLLGGAAVGRGRGAGAAAPLPPPSERQQEGILQVLITQLREQHEPLDEGTLLELFCCLEALLGRAQQQPPQPLPEEIAVLGWACLRYLLLGGGSSGDGGEVAAAAAAAAAALRRPSVRLRLGHVISLALETAEGKRGGGVQRSGRELRRSGIEALLALWRAVDGGGSGGAGGVDGGRGPQVTMAAAAARGEEKATLACFYPGVASALCRVVAGCADARQGHALTSAVRAAAPNFLIRPAVH